MRMNFLRLPVLLGFLSCTSTLIGETPAGGSLTPISAANIGLRRYWDFKLPLQLGASVSRVTLLDDNVYILADDNRAYAVHAHTGILRWASPLAEPGQAVRGPTHGRDHAYFSTSAGVRIFNRRNGDPAGEPRSLRGVVIDVQHDVVELNIGLQHGVRNGDTLLVQRPGPSGEGDGPPLAHLKVFAVQLRYAKGRLVDEDPGRRCKPGDRASAEVILPQSMLKLPFAASCAAVAGEKHLFVGAANQRFYSLDMLRGTQVWQLLTPGTVTATPILAGGLIILAGQDGRVICCTQQDRERVWVFEAEGPIFADPVLSNGKVYVACADRSLYCLDAQTGLRLWRERFDQPLDQAPMVTRDRLYQNVSGAGLVVLDAASGRQLWRRAGEWRALAEFGNDAFIWRAAYGAAGELVRVVAATGAEKGYGGGSSYGFAAASQAEQCVVLVSREGEMLCLRSKESPHLKPEQLAAVLRHDRAPAARMAPVPRIGPETPPVQPQPLALGMAHRSLLMNDWFSSSATGRPAGFTGLVDVPEEKPAASAESDDDDEESDDAEKAGDQDEDAAEESGASGKKPDAGGKKDEDKDESDDDEDEESDDDEGGAGG